MAYSSDIANLLTEQLEKFVTLNRHQLAGQVANIEFWLDEIGHCLAVIDGYDVRFERMKGAQQAYAAHHQTVQFHPETRRWDYAPETTPATPPRRVPGGELGDARRTLCKVAHRFLTRCLDDGFIDLAAFDAAHERLGIDPAELRRS